MKTTKDFKKLISELFLATYLVTSLNPIPLVWSSNSDEIVYPLQKISELDCRYQDFDSLSSSCIRDLPILNTDNYTKYAKQNDGYNDYTRIYTVLWWASYEYGWDVGYGWHTWVDIATSKWTPVYSIAEWTVIQVLNNDSERWNSISVKHKINWQTIVSNYSHLSKINIEEWDNVKVWEKIWEVGSTWNSTWNHLHFQVDYKSSYYPAYYDYDTCSYSYYKITETWVCFDQLSDFTIDPLLFLETGWAILNNTITVEKNTTASSSNKNTDNSESNLLDIFNTTVYIWYGEKNIKDVQEIFKTLWYYNWKINWNYEDVIDDIIEYQIDSWILDNKYEEWAWRFWPKTRYQAKNDYLIAIWDKEYNNDDDNDDVEVAVTNTKKISRENLLTREEIEAMEVDKFLSDYNIDLELEKAWWNVAVWDTIILNLKITNSKWRAFRWSMPSWMTFIVDEEKVSVFPQKLYYFTDWKREIKITWLKEWNTTLYVKIWNETFKTFNIKIYANGDDIETSIWTILWVDDIVYWDKKTWIILFQDNEGSKLINLEYTWNYQLKTNSDAKICLKSWNLNNIKNIYSNECEDEDFMDYKNFTYEDTVWWLVIFDYKAVGDNPEIKIIDLDANNTFDSEDITVSNPRWLDNDYEYTDEVVTLLKKWIADWINKWYFQENNELKKYDALSWIRKALISMNENPEYHSQKSVIESNLKAVYNLRKDTSKYKKITREELLNLVYEYLILDQNSYSITIKYKDLDNEKNIIANTILTKKTTWKDRFWANYFQPDTEVTRWEWVYLIYQTIQKNEQILLTLR